MCPRRASRALLIPPRDSRDCLHLTCISTSRLDDAGAVICGAHAVVTDVKPLEPLPTPCCLTGERRRAPGPQSFGCLTQKHCAALGNPTTNPCLVPHGDKDFAATLEHK